MAVLRIWWGSAPFRGSGDADNGSDPSLSAPGRFLSDLFCIIGGPLPPDMAAEECSITALFRASRALNLLTGGSADMTFSARCHVRRTGANRLSTRLAWGVVEGIIDAICGIWRGECEHCATAWANHRSRARAAGFGVTAAV
ncbi:MAG: hypothetical protein AAGB15_03205 [Pseudomonadota bacterium]